MPRDGNLYDGFALLLHAPRAVAAPTAPIECVIPGIASSMRGAAFAIRAGLVPDAKPRGFLYRKAPDDGPS